MDQNAERALAYGGFERLAHGGLTFAQVLDVCARNADFVAEFDRLRGTNLSRKGSRLALAIDDATGRMVAEVPDFVAFVWDTVWLRLPRVIVGEAR